MANTRIEIGSGPKAEDLRRLLTRGLAYAEECAHIKAVMDEAAADPDWSGVETLFGIPTGQGQAVYNLITGMNVNAQSFATLSPIRRMG